MVFTFSVFDADCDSETIFKFSRVHRPLCLVLVILTVFSVTDTSMHLWIRLWMLPTVLQYFK